MTTKFTQSNLRYLTEDKSLEKFLEFQVAWGLDIGFTPVCSALGIIGNIMSFIVLMMSKKSTTYQYLAMIALMDIIILILNIMFMVRKFPDHEIFHKETCGLIFFLMYFSIHYNVALLVTMTLERFIAIKYPLHAPKWFTIRRARIIIVVEGLLAFAFDFHNFFTRTMVKDDDSGMEQCSQEGEMNIFFIRKIWPWFDAVVYCYLPLSCLFTLNILIIREVKKAGNTKRQLTQSSDNTADNEAQSESRKQERQITIMLLLVSFCFLIFVSPMAVIIVVERYYWLPVFPHDKAVFHLVRTITNHMMYLNHALNFLLYFLSGRRFRDEFRDVFCKCLVQPKRANIYKMHQPKDNTKKAVAKLAVISESQSSIDSDAKNSSNVGDSWATLSSNLTDSQTSSNAQNAIEVLPDPVEIPAPLV
ncbi:hypothetical protein SNE40_011359 [Patella caerulea]|uniref:G-protein coupled receptors family 1 profile domain-containing protein n=1 Tax=Patella caerulea TaxID=87958 RepID=A0AAN8PI35_PATCE